jgi:hypothetical protein
MNPLTHLGEFGHDGKAVDAFALENENVDIAVALRRPGRK